MKTLPGLESIESNRIESTTARARPRCERETSTKRSTKPPRANSTDARVRRATRPSRDARNVHRIDPRSRSDESARARVRSTVHARERRRDRVKQKTCARLGRRDASRRRARARVCADDSFMTILARAHPPAGPAGAWRMLGTHRRFRTRQIAPKTPRYDARDPFHSFVRFRPTARVNRATRVTPRRRARSRSQWRTRTTRTVRSTGPGW